MSDKNKNQNTYPAPHDIQSVLWNWKMKDSAWKAASMQEASQECIIPRNSGNDGNHQGNDVKSINAERLLAMLNTLFAYDNQPVDYQNQPHLGPSGTNNWIYNTLVKETFAANRILQFFFSQINSVTPFWYYKMFRATKQLIERCSAISGIPLSGINDTILLDQRVLESIINSHLPDPWTKNPLKRILKLYTTKLQNSNMNSFSHDFAQFNHIQAINHLTTLTAFGHSEKAIRERKRAYFIFLSWICNNLVDFSNYNVNSIPFHQIDRNHLNDFATYLIKKLNNDELSHNYICYILYYVGSLFRFLYQTGYLRFDIAHDVYSDFKNKNYHYRDIPTDDNIQRFFSVIDIYAPDPIYFKSAYSLMLHLGMRRSEVAKLDWRDLNLHTKTIVLPGKSGKPTLFPLPNNVLENIKTLMPENPKGFIFGSNPDTTINTLYEYYKVFCLLADWHYPGGLHLFRHTFITKLSKRKDCTPNMLQDLARHTKASTTMGYVHRNTDSLREAVNKLAYF